MTKLCTIPNCTRRIGTGPGEDVDYANAIDMCNPHATEASWENEHTDDGHDDGEDPFDRMKDCWVCHDELNAALDTYVKGTGHTNTAAKSWNSHSECTHPRTPKARAACRKIRRAGN